MNRWLNISVAVFIAVGLFCRPMLAQTNPVNLGAGEQLVVLKNGNVIQGFVERTASDFVVQTSQGSRLIIAADQADFVCDSMEQAYWGIQARTRATDIDGQVRLFNWCLQHQLLNLAQNQIDIIQLSDIKATRLENLNRQLQVGLRQRSKTRGTALAQTATKSSAEITGGEVTTLSRNKIADTASQESDVKFFDQLDPVFTPLPSLTDRLAESKADAGREIIYQSIRSPNDDEPSEILQVGYENEIDTSEPGLSKTKQNTPVSIAELEKTTRSMPRGSLAVFRQQIENVMVVRCSGCHDSNASVMPLMHAGKRQPISRRMSQRNLHSILGFADRQNPRESPILAAAVSAHGGATEAPIEIDSKPYQNLLKWLVIISDQPQQTIVPIEPPQDDALEIDIQSIKPLKPDAASRLQDQADAEPALDLPPAIGEIPQLDSGKPSFSPRDEFDPEIFNRQYVDQID